MRLLECVPDGDFRLTQHFVGEHIPSYAILSHTWNPNNTQEVTFKDLVNGTGRDKAGFHKIQFCAEQAERHGLRYFWVDTCCIDKSDSSELQEAINSMFRWYRNAARCYVYLSDVSTTSNEKLLAQQQSPWESAFQASKWFTRGWTLQELIAPTSVEFFTQEGTRLGDRKSLEQQIHKITGIPIPALQGTALSQFDIDERFTWANTRQTTREEDWSYCLLGIFDVFIPLIYGEGKENAVWRLRKAINEARHRQGHLDMTSKLCQKQIEWLQKLYTCPYRDRKDRNPRRVDGTCAWFISHPLFRSWQQSGVRLLWVSADPGCGKSVLARCLVDSVLPSTDTRTVCYFFFKEDFEDQQSSTSALCCILHQIFTQRPTAFSDLILSKFEQKGRMLLTSFHDLWDILVSVASSLEGYEIVCILDALDECEKSGRSQIIAATSNFYSATHTHTPSLKFLLTSRPYLNIKRGFQSLEDKLPAIHLGGEKEEEVDKISREIDLVIKAKVKDVSGLSEEERNVLEEELTKVPNRTYLWVHLVFNVIMDSIFYTQGNLRSMVRKLPQSVEEVYDKILSKSRNLDLTRKLLHIVVVAKEPLTLKEMALALAIRPSHRPFSAIETVPEERFRIDVRELCGLFVVVVDSRIYLLHQTAREFLVPSLSPRSPELSSPRETGLHWKYSLRPEESHRILTEICLRRLSLPDFDLDIFWSSKNREEYIAERTFLGYSARYWAAHFRECHWAEEEWALKMAERYCSYHYPGSWTWFEIYLETCKPSLAAKFAWVFVASFSMQRQLGDCLLDNVFSDLNLKDSAWRTPIIAYDPRETDAKTFQDANFTPLLAASYLGLSQVVDRLLKRGSSDVNVKDSIWGRPVLSWATREDHAPVMQQLIAAGADVNAWDDSGDTALHYAVLGDNPKTSVHLLLKAGADVNAKAKSNHTPLHYAVFMACSKAVKTLLVAGADANAKDGSRNTPLHYAAKLRSGTIMRQLLAGGADVNAKNSQGDTALFMAIRSGDEARVQMLLEAGANVDADRGDDFGVTPLHLAAAVAKEAIVHQLLEAGANVNAKDAARRTPLSYVLETGNDSLRQQLLAAGAR